MLVQEFSLRLDKGFILSLADIFANLQKNDPEVMMTHYHIVVTLLLVLI